MIALSEPWLIWSLLVSGCVIVAVPPTTVPPVGSALGATSDV